MASLFKEAQDKIQTILGRSIPFIFYNCTTSRMEESLKENGFFVGQDYFDAEKISKKYLFYKYFDSKN